MKNKPSKCPQILQYSRRAIFWSCEDRGDSIFAAIAFFNTNLGVKDVKLSDQNGNYYCQVAIPEMFLKQRSRGRAQNISLKIVSRA